MSWKYKGFCLFVCFWLPNNHYQAWLPWCFGEQRQSLWWEASSDVSDLFTRWVSLGTFKLKSIWFNFQYIHLTWLCATKNILGIDQLIFWHHSSHVSPNPPVKKQFFCWMFHFKNHLCRLLWDMGLDWHAMQAKAEVWVNSVVQWYIFVCVYV